MASLILCYEVRAHGLCQLFRLGLSRAGGGQSQQTVSNDQDPDGLPPAPLYHNSNTQDLIWIGVFSVVYLMGVVA